MMREHDGRAWAAWWTARLGREQRMTPLRKLLAPRRGRVMAPDELEAALAAAFGALGADDPAGLKDQGVV